MSGAKEKLKLVYVSVDDLIPFSGNPRKIRPRGLEKLQTSVENFGFVNPIIAQRDTNMIISGHQRLKAAKAAGLSQVAVIFVDFDDVTAKAYNLADNKLHDETEWDFDSLADVLGELDTGAFDLTIMGFDENELERLMTWIPDLLVEDPGVFELEEESTAKFGDLYQLGDHVLLCGDATDEGSVALLIDSARKPSLIFTSPPYPGADMWEQSGEELIRVGNTALKIVAGLLDDGAVLAWNTSDIPRGNDGYVPNIARDTLTALDLGLKLRGEIIWDKDIKALPMPGAYRRPTVPNNTHEAILIFFKGKWKPRDKKGSLHSEAMK